MCPITQPVSELPMLLGVKLADPAKLGGLADPRAELPANPLPDRLEPPVPGAAPAFASGPTTKAAEPALKPSALKNRRREKIPLLPIKAKGKRCA